MTTTDDTIADEAPQPVEIITELAKLEPLALVTEAGLAKMFRVTERTVRNMVSRGELPPPIQLARRSTWMAGKILSHIESQIERAAKSAPSWARKAV